jgi:predicted ATPase
MLMRAQGLNPYSLATAMTFAAIWHQLCRDRPVTQEWAEHAIAISTVQGFPFWLGHGTVLRGWALAAQGHGAEGMAQIRQGITTWHATGAEVARPYALALLAEACGNASQAEEGLELLAEALAVAHQHEERYYEAELHRLRGELLLVQALPEPRALEAEVCFWQAIDLARRQQAKSWELRAVMSLSRLWQLQGKPQAAQQLLAEVYGWFTEGFATTDLQEAKRLLEALGA